MYGFRWRIHDWNVEILRISDFTIIVINKSYHAKYTGRKQWPGDIKIKGHHQPQNILHTQWFQCDRFQNILNTWRFHWEGLWNTLPTRQFHCEDFEIFYLPDDFVVQDFEIFYLPDEFIVKDFELFYLSDDFVA